MLALENELEKAIEEAPAQEAPAPEAEAAVEAQQQSSEGPVPEVSTAAAPAAATASQQAFGTTAAPTTTLGAGMFKHHEYKAACMAAGTPDKWQERYWHGHTDAKQWTQPYEGRFDNVFALKRHQSASQGVKDFIKGPTISNFRVLHGALELEQVRAELGDLRFDALFGSANGFDDDRIPSGQRLQINAGMYTVPFREQMLALANEEVKPEEDLEPEAPAVAAGVEHKPHETATPQPAPELIADELGMQREQELV
jgi:hypothetical protein